MLSLISHLISGSIHNTVARTKRNGIFVAIASLLFLTAYGFALVAAAVWLAGLYGAIGAALLLAAGALLLGIIVLVVMMIMSRQEAQRARDSRASLDTMAAAALHIVKSQPLLTTAVAAAFLLSNLIGKDSRRDRD
jgi:hypothetical protein